MGWVLEVTHIIEYPEFRMRRAVRQAARADPSLLPVSKGLSYIVDNAVQRIVLQVTGKLRFNSRWVVDAESEDLRKLVALKLFSRQRALSGGMSTGDRA